MEPCPAADDRVVVANPADVMSCRAGRWLSARPLSIRGHPAIAYPGHPAIFVPGDLMSAHSLAGAAEVAVQPGLQVAYRIPVGRK